MNTTLHRNKLLFTLLGTLLGVLMAMGMTALAEDSELDTGPRAIPYNGELVFGGEPYEGTVDLLITLSAEPVCVLEEAHPSVEVRGGHFSVNIGAVEGDVPTCVFDAESVFIELAVRESGDEQPHRALAGRQKLNPVPFAYWAAEGSDLKVDGTLNVTDNAIINGELRAGAASLSGDALQTQGGDITAGGGNINTGGGDLVTGSGGVALGGEDISGVGTLSGHEGAAVGVNSNLQVAQGRTTFLQNTTDQALGTNGALVVGDVGDINLAIDGDEVLARDNGANSTLFIQREGGDTQFDGDVEIVSGKNLSVSEINALDVINTGGRTLSTGGNLTVGGQLDIGLYRATGCSSGENGITLCSCDDVFESMVGGGGKAPSGGVLRSSYPDRNFLAHWIVQCAQRNQFNSRLEHTDCEEAYALCMRIRP